jgi:hypothetical protein
MIYTYSYYPSDADKLNEFVLAFFDIIEFETGDFTTDFFEKEFYDNLVRRHKGILLKPFKKIYEITKTWKQSKRTSLCNAIRDSNKIEEICAGKIKFTDFSDLPSTLVEILLNLFKQLYKDVLFGEFFTNHYGSRKSHYHDFLKHKENELDWCPACGIRPMHRFTEDITEQYDHYLPKDLYPFSSVNFKNLVPICNDCNSLQVKKDDDILLHTGKVFYPFDEKHQPIEITIGIAKNDTDIEKVKWKITYKCQQAKNQELTAWKQVYKIEDRHQKHCVGKIKKWHKDYWEYFMDKDTIDAQPDENKRKSDYIRSRVSSPIEHKCLTAIISDGRALRGSLHASRY